MDRTDTQESFVAYASAKLSDHLGQIERCVNLLSDEHLWFRPNAHTNSVANLLLHLRGNLGQWILNGLGGQPFPRDRSAEFDRRGELGRAELMGPLRETAATAIEIVQHATGQSLGAAYTIQGYRVTGLEVVFHVVEHFAFHTGQIVTTTKWLLDVDLELYDENGGRLDGRRSSVP